MPELLSWMKVPPELELAIEGVGDAWHALDEGLRAWPPGTAIAKGATAKRAKSLVAALAFGSIVVRRSVIEPVLGSFEEIALHPIAIADKSGSIVDRDFCVLDVRAHAPLDRSSVKATWKNGFLETLESARWERAPRARIFRVGEALGEIGVDEAVGTALAKATKGWLGVREVSEKELAQRAVFTVHPDHVPALEHDEDAEAEYWRLERGESGNRARVCRSACFAYWLARTVDREPREDTRRAAATHPVYAFLYALFDAPSALLEDAVAAHYWSAHAYCRYVVKRIPERLEQVLRESGLDLDEERAEIASYAVFR